MPTNLSLTTPVYSTGKYGKGLVLNGSGSGVGIGGKIPGSGSITCELWVKASAPSAALTVIAGQQNAFWFGLESSGSVGAYYGSTNEQKIGGPVITDNQWHHLELAFGAFGAVFFVDGVKIGTSAVSDATALVKRADWNFVVGKFEQYTNYWFNGMVDEVAIWSGQRHADAFTPAGPYVGDEENLVYLYHVNDSGVDSDGETATPTPTPTPSYLSVARTNAAIQYSPYTWQDNGTARIANSCGSYLFYNCTGSTVGIDITALTGLTNYPVLRAYIDNLPAIDIQLSGGQTRVIFTEALPAGTHRVVIGLKVQPNGESVWTLASALKVTGILVASGAVVSAATRRSKNMIFAGDSITQGHRQNGTVQPASDDAFTTEAVLLAEALDAELGQLGYGSTNYAAGNGDVPGFNTSYSLYSAGSTRLVGGVLSPAPDYVFVMHGTNGGASQSDVATAITNLRTIAPTAKIGIFVPPGGFGRAGITAAVNAARTAGDLNVFLADCGTGSLQSGLNGNNGAFSIGPANEMSSDTIHPNPKANARLSARRATIVQRAIEPRRFTVVAS